MRKLLLSCLALLSAWPVWAAQRTQGEAMDIARSFLAQRSTTRALSGELQLAAVSSDLLPSAATRGAASSEPSFYVFNQGASAYVIVSGDDSMKPILGYSDEGAFVTENLPDNIRGWLELCDAAYNEAVKGEARVQPVSTSATTRSNFAESVAPLLGDINYNQDEPYNGQCPMIRGERAMTGCVATAMAMVMRYWQYPEHGQGEHAITDRETGIVSSYRFDFGNATFDWADMLPSYGGDYTDTQAAAVAELMYACGVAVDMEYSTDASAAIDLFLPQAVIDYFCYNPNTSYRVRNFYTEQEWMDLIKTELNAGRPIIYSGISLQVGHEFVFDGYDANDMVHVNWGWGGANNGYFEVASLNPASTGIGGGTTTAGGYNRSQAMIINMQPEVGETTSRAFLTTDGNLSINNNGSNTQINAVTVTKGEAVDFAISAFDDYGNFLQGRENTAIIYNYNGRDFCGTVDLVLEAADGTQTILGSVLVSNEEQPFPSEITIYAWAINEQMADIVIPADLADGTYTLYMAAKDTRESTWERIRTMYGGVDQYTVTVSGNQCVFTPHALSKAIDNVVMSLSPTHTFYEGSLMDFVVTIQNNDPVYEYYGEISVSLYESDGSVQYTPFGGLPVIVKPGEIVEVPISGSLSLQSGNSIVPLPAGTYLAAVIYGWGPYSYPNNNGLIQVDVLVSTGQLTLGAQNARLAKTRIGLNAPLNYMATLEGFGRGSYYSSTVGVALDADKGDGRIPYMQNVFFESGETYEFTAEFVPELGAGDHSVTLCAYSETAGGYQVVDGTQVNFTIDPTVGIEDAVGGATTLTVLDQPVEDVLTMTAPAGLQTLNIYNQAGQLVSTVDLSATSGERYSVEVSNLVSGFYIVNATAADGKTFRSKFVKK